MLDTFLSNIISNFNQEKPLEILDVGCGNGEMLFEIFRTFSNNFTKLKGIDNQENPHNIPFQDSLEYTYNSTAWDTTKNAPNGLFQYEILDIEDYVKVSTEHFDIIILSNILHFFSKNKILDLIRLYITLLNNNGVLYINMANDKHDYSIDSRKTVLDIDLENELRKSFNILDISHCTIHTKLSIAI